MLTIAIPEFGTLELAHLVLDYNGTLAVDGRLLPGVADTLKALALRVRIHVITADTFGAAKEQLAGLPVQLTVIPADNQAEAKLDFIKALGAAQVAAIGNGRIDRKMLALARLGIAIIGREGASAQAIAAADVVTTSIVDALDLLLNPKRLVATLRS